jgi:hypothetical protein
MPLESGTASETEDAMLHLDHEARKVLASDRQEELRRTAQPFRVRELAGRVDSVRATTRLARLWHRRDTLYETPLPAAE